MDTSHLIWIPTIILFVLGIVGTVIPMMPGILLISLGVLWQGIMGNSALTWWQWLSFALIALTGLIIDKVISGVGAKVFGSARGGIFGAIAGVIIGPLVMTPLLGIIVGPFAGAVIGELVFSRKNVAQATLSGTGATLGVLTGIIFEIAIGITLVSWFLICYFLLGR